MELASNRRVHQTALIVSSDPQIGGTGAARHAIVGLNVNFEGIL